MQKDFSNKGFDYLDRLIHYNRKIVLDADIDLDNVIEIDGNDLIIDGKGHTIDALAKTQIFQITGDNILIKNVTFKNACSKKSGAAISNFKGKLTLTNCKFINNVSSNGDGGAICNWDGALTIEECKFIKNSSNNDGGALFNGNEMTITDCIFTDNSSKRGLSIFNKSDSSLGLKNSVFKRGKDSPSHDAHINNEIFNKGIINIDSFEKEYYKKLIRFGFIHCFSANAKPLKNLQNLIDESQKEIALDFDIELSDDDAEICINVDDMVIDGNGHTIDALAKNSILTINSKNVTLKNINFKNSNSKDACLKITGKSSLNIVKCSFENNFSEKGGAIDNHGKLTVCECNFENDSCEIDGGAINNNGDLTLTKCSFKNNISFKSGGSISNGRFLKLEGCKFNSSLAEYGGAIKNDLSGLANIIKCSFEGNMAFHQGSIIFNDGHISISNSRFLKNASNKDCHMIYQGGDVDSELVVEYCSFSQKLSQNNLIYLKDGFCLIKSSKFDVNDDYYMVYNENASLKYLQAKFADSNEKAIFNSGNLSIRKEERIENTIKNMGVLNYIDEKLPEDWKGFTYLDNLIHSHSKNVFLDCDIEMHLSEQDFYEGGIGIDRDNLVIDGKGHTIDANDFSRIFLISSRNVVIKNVKFINGKYFKSKFDFEDNGGGAIYAMPGSSAEIRDCIFSHNKSRNSAGAILNKSKYLKIKNLRFENNTAKNKAGTIFNIKSSVDLIDVDFIDNSAASSGCICNKNSHVDMSNIQFSKNHAHSAGAISNHGSSVRLDGCRFGDNFSDDCAGAVLNYRTSCEFDDCKFLNNNSNGEGGVIFNQYGDVELNNCRFIKNTSKQNGGGIFNKNSSLSLVECNFTNNSASDRGGAIENNFDSKICLRDCRFSGNSADSGGAISNMKKCRLSIKNSNFKNNSAEHDAGAVFNHFGFTDIDNCRFLSNKSEKYAGAFDNYLGWVNIKKTKFKNNSVKAYAGAIFNGGMIKMIGGCHFENNHALLKGGAIYATKSSSTNISESKFNSNRAIGNGGLGGAIFNNSYSDGSIECWMDLVDCEFLDNTANDDGGAIFNKGAITLDKCYFDNNITVKQGETFKNDGRNVKVSIKNTNLEC